MIIYKITNTRNGLCYVGLTRRSISERFSQHCSEAIRRKGKKSPLSVAIREYGRNAFSIEELARADSLPELRALERSLIAEHGCLARDGKGYNVNLGGQGAAGPMSIENLIRLRARQHLAAEGIRLAWQDPVKRASMTESRKGRKRSADSIAKQRAALALKPPGWNAENNRKTAEAAARCGPHHLQGHNLYINPYTGKQACRRCYRHAFY